MDGVDGRAAAALAGSLVSRLVRTAGAAGRRTPEFVQLRAEQARFSPRPAAPTWSWWSSPVPMPTWVSRGWRCSMPRAAGLMRALEPWVEGPLQTFLDESSARLTLLMTSSGQVVAQHGFSRSLDVMTAAALGAGIGASTESSPG